MEEEKTIYFMERSFKNDLNPLPKQLKIIISFCQTNMYSERSMNLDAEEDLSFFREGESFHLMGDEPVLGNWRGMDYLEQGDSMVYIEQFLNFKEDKPEEEQKMESKGQIQQLKTSDSLSSQKTLLQPFLKKFKKTKKVENSPFHNYQKHLNNALKRLIIVPSFGPSDEDYKLAARDIWRRYLQIEVKTKRILHFVFNQRNEHIINESQLRTYGLLEIYKHYEQEVINKAKNYLSRLAIDQIDAMHLQGYLKTRKIKRMEGLKTYILNFKHELQSGYLKRRITMSEPHL